MSAIQLVSFSLAVGWLEKCFGGSLLGAVNKPPVDAPEPSQWHHAHVADSLEKTQGGKRRNLHVRTGEHDIGPSFHRGTCQGGSGCAGQDDDPRLCQPRQTTTRPTARSRRRKMGGRPIRRRLFQPQVANRGPASLAAQGGASTTGLADLPLLQAC